MAYPPHLTLGDAHLHPPRGWTTAYDAVTGTTTDATPTAIFSQDPWGTLSGSGRSEIWEAIVHGIKTSATKECYAAKVVAHVFWSSGATGTLIDSSVIYESQTPTPATEADAYTAEIQINSTNLEVMCKGAAAETVSWKVFVKGSTYET